MLTHTHTQMVSETFRRILLSITFRIISRITLFVLLVYWIVGPFPEQFSVQFALNHLHRSESIYYEICLRPGVKISFRAASELLQSSFRAIKSSAQLYCNHYLEVVCDGFQSDEINSEIL